MATTTKRTHRRSVALALALSLAIGGSGCGRTGWQLFGAMVEVAAYVAVTALVLGAHDAHYHSAYCGHGWVIYEDRPVYYYQDRWEYYEPHARVWYYYPEGIPGY